MELHHLSRVMRKPVFCICEKTNRSFGGDQRLCFHYIDSTIPRIRYFKPLNIFCGHTAQFVSGLVRNPEDKFSLDEAQLFYHILLTSVYKYF